MIFNNNYFSYCIVDKILFNNINSNIYKMIVSHINDTLHSMFFSLYHEFFKIQGISQFSPNESK